MSESVRHRFIDYAVRQRLMPDVAPRMPDVVSLVASDDTNKPVHFWQLYSILGDRPVLTIVTRFYTLVYEDSTVTPFFRDSFARISSKEHHINTQAAMWLDCLGRGKVYHGGSYRLSFHHTQNAKQIMTSEGGREWVSIMTRVLDEACAQPGGALVRHFGGDMAQVARVRCSLNTFLGWFLDDYAQQFNFDASCGMAGPLFGQRNPPIGTDGRVLMASPTTAASPASNAAATSAAPSLLDLDEAQIRALGVKELRAALIRHKVDVSKMLEKDELVAAALRL